MANSYPDMFNTVFGPIMQGGSSSHTAAPARIGYMAHSLLAGEQVKKIDVIMPKDGGFAHLFGLMQEDYGLLAGGLGFNCDDPRMFDAFDIAKEKGIEYNFIFDTVEGSDHFGRMRFELTSETGRMVTLVADSVSGGAVKSHLVNGFPIVSEGEAHCVIVTGYDSSNELKAIAEKFVDSLDSAEVENQAGEKATYFKVNVEVDLAEVQALAVQARVCVMTAVQPVLAQKEPKPQLFNTMTQWREIAEQRGLPLWEVALQYQMDASGWSRSQVINYMKMLAHKMHRQTHAIYEDDNGRMHPYYEGSPYNQPEHDKWSNYMDNNKTLSGDVNAEIMKRCWAVLAMKPGVELVPGPMGNGGGVIYSAVGVIKEREGYSEEDLLRGLFIAGGLGVLAYTRTVPAGSVIGCTGETGMSGALAAAAIVEMSGGTPEQVEAAASLLLQSVIGIPCDPIAGGNMQPCGSRAVMGATLAPIFADMALSGRTHILPFHEVLDSADRLGRQISENVARKDLGLVPSPTSQETQKNFIAWFEMKNA